MLDLLLPRVRWSRSAILVSRHQGNGLGGPGSSVGFDGSGGSGSSVGFDGSGGSRGSSDSGGLLVNSV